MAGRFPGLNWGGAQGVLCQHLATQSRTRLAPLPDHPVATGTVFCEEPNSRMHQFVGILEWNSKKYPLDIGNLLLRGCRVRNTDTCYGLVIYAGTVLRGPCHGSCWGGKEAAKPGTATTMCLLSNAGSQGSPEPGFTG